MMAAESWRDFIPPPVGDVSVEQWVELDLAHVEQAGGLSAPEIRNAWAQFTRCIPGATQLRGINRLEVIAVFRWLRAQSERTGKPAPNTVAKWRSLLRASFSRATGFGYLEANPMSDWPAGVLPDRKAVVERSSMSLDAFSVSRLISHPEIPFMRRALYTFLFATGTRIGEAMAATFGALKVRAGRNGVRVDVAWSQKRGAMGATKTRSAAVVPSHPVLEEVLAELWQGRWVEAFGRQPTEQDLLFPRLWLGELHPQYQNYALKMWKADLALLGLAPRALHCTRHTFMSLGRAAGADIDALDSLIHAKKRGDMKAHYGAWPWERLCAEIEKLPIVRHRDPEQASLWGNER